MKKIKEGITLKTMLKNTPFYVQDKADEKYLIEMKDTKSKKGRKAIAAKVQRKPKKAGDKPEIHKLYIMGLDNHGPLSKQNCRVSCDCSHFMFYWEYALTAHGASQIKYSNGEPPHTTNPHLVPGVCSHLWLALSKIVKAGK